MPKLEFVQRLRASFWFVPALVVLASMAVAALLVELDAVFPGELSQWSPRLFGASAEGSRAMLSAIATSMITVAGVVFSITVVILSQASTQYSPRVLRNFMSDRPTQVVLGVFVGAFAYCLVVLRTVRGGDDAGMFIPSVAVLGGMAYAFAAIATLIFFIHHIAQAIQASAILERIADDTRRAIDELFPDELGQDADAAAQPALPAGWTPVRAKRSGYIVSVDTQGVLAAARDHGRILRLAAAIGAFVPEGAILLELGGAAPLPAGEARRLRGLVRLERQRTTAQDAAFGLQQLVDVAVKALSPGINDPTTACMCIDRLGASLARLAGRRMPGPRRMEGGRLLAIAPAPTFEGLLALAFEPLIAYGRNDVQVLARLLDAFRVVHDATLDHARRAAVLQLVCAVQQALERAPAMSRAAAALAQARALTASTGAD